MSVSYYGDFAEDDTVLIPFNTFSSDDPSASVTVTTLIASDVKVHKDGGTTEIATDGASISVDFDSRTGAHLITVDTSAHADYSTGSEYAVMIEGATVDGGNITAWVGAFSIERAGGALALLKDGIYGLSAIETLVDDLESRLTAARAGYLDELGPTNIPADVDKIPKSDGTTSWNATALAAINAEADTALSDYDPPTKAELDTAQGAVTLANGSHGGAAASITLADYSDFTGAAAANPNVLQSGTITVTTQTSFTLNAGSADNDAYNNMVIVLEDSATATQKSVRTITDYVGASKTVTIDSAPDFTIASTDNFDILAVAPGSTPPTVGQIRTEMDTNSTQLAAIVADTNELQTDNIPGTLSTMDGKLDTIDNFLDTEIADLPTVAEFEARTLPSADYVVVGDTIARVTLVDTVTTNTDMVTEPPTTTEIQTEMEENGASILDTLQDRVTASVALASVCTEGRLSELDAANLPSDISDILTDTSTTLQGELDGIQADTEDIQSRLPAALVSGRMASDSIAVSGSTDAADKLEESAETIVLGSASTGTLSTTTMTTDLTITINEQYNGRVIIFRSNTTTAALRGQATDITDTVTTNGQLTFTALTTAPVNGDTFVIV